MRSTLLALALLSAGTLNAQIAPTDPAVRDSVLATVDRLFAGMRAHDTAMVRSAFAPGALMTEFSAASPEVSFQSVDAFVTAVARPGEPWIERVFDPEVRVDGDLASYLAWYTFSLGERLLHCGVDAFWVVRTSAGWRIAAISDTRHTTGCDAAGG